MTFKYMLTVKDNASRVVEKRELDQALSIIRQLIAGAEYSDYVGYELDSRGYMHCHTMITVPNRLSQKQIARLLSIATGFHTHLQFIPASDCERAMEYTRKEGRPPCRLEQISRSIHIARQFKRAGNLFRV